VLGTTWEDRLLRVALEVVLDWQWNDYLSKQVPQDYLDELYGSGVGGFDGISKHFSLSKTYNNTKFFYLTFHCVDFTINQLD
jgi:hypothetical protein